MATAFIVLSYVHIVPLRLTVMVISRDIIILTGSLIYLLLFDASDIRPTGLSKANTAVQILTVIYFLSIAAFPAEAKALGTGRGTLPDRAVTLICATTTVALRAPVPVHRHPEALRCVRAPGTVRRGSASASRPCRPDPPRNGPGSSPGTGSSPCRAARWRTSSTSISSPRGAGSPSRGGTRRGPPGKRSFACEGETPGIFPEPIRVRRCRNRCIFCFVHQLPKGLRRTLYVKDEDVRLSFLHGQYVTFSDLSEEEDGEDRPVPSLAALRVDPHDRPGAAPADAREPAGGRRDAP